MKIESNNTPKSSTYAVDVKGNRFSCIDDLTTFGNTDYASDQSGNFL